MTAPGPRSPDHRQGCGTAARLVPQPMLSDSELRVLQTGAFARAAAAAAARYRAGYAGGACHAAEAGDAGRASARGRLTGAQPATYAICGQYVIAGDREYDRTTLTALPCRECAWAVALEAGSTGLELALMTPGASAAAAIARAGVDPMLAVHVCRAVLDAESGAGAAYGADHHATAQILAQAAGHMPVPATPAGQAAHPTAGDAPLPAGPPRGQAGPAVVCVTCSLRAGAWAEEAERGLMPECVVPAPCGALRSLARHFGVPQHASAAAA